MPQNLRLRILVADDDPHDREPVCYVLESKHDVDQAGSLRDTLEHIERAEHDSRGQYDVILLDLDMGDSRGAFTFRAVNRKAAPIPIVVHTGSEDLDTCHTLLTEGAAGYYTKSPNPNAVAMLEIKLRMAAIAAREIASAKIGKLQLAEYAERRASQLEDASKAVGRLDTTELSVQVMREAVTQVSGSLAVVLRILATLAQEQAGLKSATATANHEIVTLKTGLRDLSPGAKGGLAVGATGVVFMIARLIIESGMLERIFGGG